MAIKPGKTEVRKLAAVLDQEYATVEEAAEAALVAAWELYESKGKYTVVGQVRQSDGKGDKIALGRFGTANQATTAALQLAYSSVTHEECLAWVLEVHPGSPHEWFKARKQAKQASSDERNWRAREQDRRVEWFKNRQPGEEIPVEFGVAPLEMNSDQCVACNGTGRVIREELIEEVRQRLETDPLAARLRGR